MPRLRPSRHVVPVTMLTILASYWSRTVVSAPPACLLAVLFPQSAINEHLSLGLTALLEHLDELRR